MQLLSGRYWRLAILPLGSFGSISLDRARKLLTTSSERKPIEHLSLPASFHGRLIGSDFVWITLFRYQTERITHSSDQKERNQNGQKACSSSIEVLQLSLQTPSSTNEADSMVAYVHFWFQVQLGINSATNI